MLGCYFHFHAMKFGMKIIIFKESQIGFFLHVGVAQGSGHSRKGEFYWSSVEIVIKCSLRICRPDVPAVRPAIWKFLLAQAKRAGLRPWPVTELTNCSLVDRSPCIFQHIVGLNCNGHHMIERAKMS